MGVIRARILPEQVKPQTASNNGWQPVGLPALQLAQAICGLGLAVLAGFAPRALAVEPIVIPLWPEGVPDLRADASEERIISNRVVNVHYPSLTCYAPEPGKANGTAVIYCPGGGYVRLAIGENGGEETRWLTRCGATVFVLKYRLVEYGHPAPLRDVLRAVRIVRSRAAEFHVQTNRVGVLGASAGGHLAACAATLFDSPLGRTGAPLDVVSARPDFAVLIFPVVTMEEPFVHKGSRDALLGKGPSPELVDLLSIEKHVPKNAPPFFLAATAADKSVPVENTLRLYQALRDAGVSAEMHVYAQGSHGNSLDPQYGPTAQWPQRVEDWMRFNGRLPKPD